MSNEFITIQEASKLSGRSMQTIRRALKLKKLKFRRRKTAQGFNYQVNYESLIDLFKIGAKGRKVIVEDVDLPTNDLVVEEEESEHSFITSDDFQRFTESIESLVRQQSDERQNFLRLVNTLQEKIFVLENQINLLAAPKKSWYQFWR